MDAKHGVKVLEQIGSGGFGNVYKCMYKDSVHVVKKIKIGISDASAIAELTILTQVDHPRVLKLIKYYKTKADWTFVLEFMEKGSLRTTIEKYQKNKWKFSQEDLLHLFMDIAFGVKHLHSKGIIHRDLKPENILVDENHRLKIADFGISKLVQPKPEHHTIIGTIRYMAPEVYLMLPYDKTVDIWALGIIFFEMAMLAYPFSKAEKSRLLNDILEYIPPVIDCARRKYDPAVQDLLLLMLQRDPKKRSDLSTVCRQPIVRSIRSQLVKEQLDCV